MTDMTRRDFQTALALGFIGPFANDDDLSLGWFDDHAIADDGEKVAIDPELIDFVGSLEVEDTPDGVEIGLDPEELEAQLDLAAGGERESAEVEGVHLQGEIDDMGAHPDEFADGVSMGVFVPEEGPPSMLTTWKVTLTIDGQTESMVYQRIITPPDFDDPDIFGAHVYYRTFDIGEEEWGEWESGNEYPEGVLYYIDGGDIHFANNTGESTTVEVLYVEIDDEQGEVVDADIFDNAASLDPGEYGYLGGFDSETDPDRIIRVHSTVPTQNAVFDQDHFEEDTGPMTV